MAKGQTLLPPMAGFPGLPRGMALVGTTSLERFSLQATRQQLVKGDEAEQIYYTDETRLFYRQLGKKTLAFKDNPKNLEDMKQFKERVTFLLAANFTGIHKLEPFPVGKF